MRCKLCGGDIIGDGYSTILHCENAEYETYYDKAPDEDIVLCDKEDKS